MQMMEILFLGGVLATYAGQQHLNVQVCYMTNYWDGDRRREHEKLDGLWKAVSEITLSTVNFGINMQRASKGH